MGVVAALPAILAAFKSIASSGASAGGKVAVRDEMGLARLILVGIGGIAMLFLAAFMMTDRPTQLVLPVTQPYREVEVNLAHIGNMIDLVTHICSLELPVRLITLGEGAIQGFVDEILDMEQSEYAETMAAEIPGPETDALDGKGETERLFHTGPAENEERKIPGPVLQYRIPDRSGR